MPNFGMLFAYLNKNRDKSLYKQTVFVIASEYIRRR